MSPQRLRSQVLFDSNCGVTIAQLDDILVGHAFYSKFVDNILGKVCWITQLVVDSNIRNRGVAKNLLNISFDPDCRICGLVTSHPFAIRSLEKATGFKVEPTIISAFAPSLIQSTSIPYIRDRPVYCSNTNCVIDTEFFVDHTEILQLLEKEPNWIMGDLPEGHEFFAFVKRW